MDNLPVPGNTVSYKNDIGDGQAPCTLSYGLEEARALVYVAGVTGEVYTVLFGRRCSGMGARWQSRMEGLNSRKEAMEAMSRTAGQT